MPTAAQMNKLVVNVHCFCRPHKEILKIMFNVYTGILLQLSYPITGLKKPFGFQEVEAARLSR